MLPIKRAIAALAAALSLCAHAVSFSTDFSDLWSILPQENGWGANVVQQGDTLFITMFVYGPDNEPTWYVGPATRFAAVGADNALVFEGPLYATTGPWFGAPTYDPATVVGTPVGLVQFSASDINQARLVYSVNDAVVTKNVRRQTFTSNSMTGSYRGASLATYSGCAAADNGYKEHAALVDVNHPNALSAITLREETPAYTCNYNGVYSQTGRLGRIDATGTCTDGRTPTLTATEVDVTFQGISMRFVRELGGSCRAVGRMGGIRRAG